MQALMELTRSFLTRGKLLLLFFVLRGMEVAWTTIVTMAQLNKHVNQDRPFILVALDLL